MDVRSVLYSCSGMPDEDGSAADASASPKSARKAALEAEFGKAHLTVKATIGRLLIARANQDLEHLGEIYEQLELAAAKAGSFARMLSRDK